MQPSHDRDETSARSLRRWLPVGVIAAAAVAVGALVVAGGGGDEEAQDDVAGSSASDATGTTDSNDAGASESELPEGAISFSAAEEQGLDVEFPDTCDLETGRVAMPVFFSSECYADAEPQTTPGTPGVTDDTITVVVYLRQPDDPIYLLATAPIAVDDTNEQVRATYEGYVEMYNRFSQTYGRQVELKFLEASGTIADEVAARADAVRAVEEMGAFAVWGGPELTNAWTDEIRARGVLCIGCAPVEDPAPLVFSGGPSTDQGRVAFLDYAAKKLADGNAEYAGDEAMHDQERVYGHVYVDVGTEEAREHAKKMREGLGEVGIDVVEQIGYELDPVTLQEQAGATIARLKAAGVTTVIYEPDPIGPVSLTAEATRQDYFPEWVLAGPVLADTTAFGRTYDQEQWSHAFGISALPARAAPETSPAYVLWDWYFGGLPDADEAAQLLWPNPAAFFIGVQAAGPNLTAATFRDGLFSLPAPASGITFPTISFGDRGIWDDWVDQGVELPDYYGIDDWVEIWWDPEAEGPDEIFNVAKGLYRYVDGGARYSPGEWPEELKAFDPKGSVTFIEEIPEGEQPPDYPRPEPE